MSPRYHVFLTPHARTMLKSISDARIQAKVKERIDGLDRDPELQGKPLSGELAGYRSVRAAGQRFRIIYRVHRHQVEVHIVAVGRRREGSREDIYRLAQKLFRLKLI